MDFDKHPQIIQGWLNTSSCVHLMDFDKHPQIIQGWLNTSS
jgi:hypothetical protein